RTRRAIQKKIKRIEKGLLAKNNELELSTHYKEIRHFGELLKANFQNILPKMKEITVTDWEHENAVVTIPLDPSYTPQQQLKAYFQKSKKYERAAAPLQKAIVHLEKERETWLQRLAELEVLKDKEELLHFQKTYSICHVAPKAALQPEKKQQPHPFHTFTSHSGIKIFVGKSAEANDFLTFQIARGDDLWLHAHGAPGSHVVIKKGNKEFIEQEAVLDAAALALYFSKLRNASNQEHEVVLTERKYVQRTKGAPHGQVILSKYKLLRIQLDLARIDLIKSRSSP
ncbi:MAG: putative fibronectin/fibrinogen binding protein, partial [Chlamydiia bacterium]|nr:putative fibronectin/fibrinogen binding protein [Chlamydiia bacterium]